MAGLSISQCSKVQRRQWQASQTHQNTVTHIEKHQETSLDRDGNFGNMFELVWTCLSLFEMIWDTLRCFGQVWEQQDHATSTFTWCKLMISNGSDDNRIHCEQIKPDAGMHAESDHVVGSAGMLNYILIFAMYVPCWDLESTQDVDNWKCLRWFHSFVQRQCCETQAVLYASKYEVMISEYMKETKETKNSFCMWLCVLKCVHVFSLYWAATYLVEEYGRIVFHYVSLCFTVFHHVGDGGTHSAENVQHFSWEDVGICWDKMRHAEI